MYALRVSTPPTSGGLLNRLPYSSTRAEPSITIPPPSVSSACITVPSLPSYTACFSNPKAAHSHSMAAFASRYRCPNATILPAFVPAPVVVSISTSMRSILAAQQRPHLGKIGNSHRTNHENGCPIQAPLGWGRHTHELSTDVGAPEPALSLSKR